MQQLAPSKACTLYHWQGIHENNTAMRGLMMAEHPIIVKNELLKQGFRSIAIQQASSSNPRGLTGGARKISEKNILSVFYQLNTLLKSNIPILQALQLIMQNTSHTALRSMLQQIVYRIAAGNTFSEAIQQYPTLFPAHFSQLIAVGEKTGDLSTICQTIVNNLEHLQQFKKKLGQAIFYPCLLFVLSIGIIMLLLLLVIPQFEQIFHAFHTETPTITRMIIQLSHGVQKVTYYHLPMICLPLLILFRIQTLTRFGNTTVSNMLEHLPWVGKILIYHSLTRFYQTLHITYRSGIPIKDALNLSMNTLIVHKQKLALQPVCSLINQGETLLKAFQSFEWPLAMTLPILSTAESTGQLDTVLEYLAKCYAEHTEHLMGIACHLLEPLLMIILGVLIGSVVIGLYLPLFQLGMHF